MKAFKILEFDKRPMKIKGNKIIAATLIPLTDDSLAHGDFIAMPSGKKVELVSGGMLAKAHADAKPAFSFMKPKGASVGVELLEVDSPYESVFVESYVKTSVHRSILSCEMMLPELYGFWIPGDFVASDGTVREGWFKLGEANVEVCVLGGESGAVSGEKVIAKHDENLVINL